jgi:hypothetical protein
VFHLPLPHDPAQRFLRARPPANARWTEALDDLLAVQDPATVAAVIVEPVTGSGGAYPPPVGYLEALRAICDRHGILLIFAEVITGFGRLGACTAAEALGVSPEIMAMGNGLTNGAVPMGAALVNARVYEAFMTAPRTAPELMHGYTYSAHPLACAAGLATLDAYEQEGMFAAAAPFAAALLALEGAPHVIDGRCSSRPPRSEGQYPRARRRHPPCHLRRCGRANALDQRLWPDPGIGEVEGADLGAHAGGDERPEHLRRRCVHRPKRRRRLAGRLAPGKVRRGAAQHHLHRGPLLPHLAEQHEGHALHLRIGCGDEGEHRLPVGLGRGGGGKARGGDCGEGEPADRPGRDHECVLLPVDDEGLSLPAGADGRRRRRGAWRR